jgi:hypothetical protein
MARSSPTRIRVMISSRCNDLFPLEAKDASSLSAIRLELKDEIEAQRLFGQPVYDVWINEKATADASQPAWEQCMDEARTCDIFIALFNGNAGWADTSGTIGICHAEFEAAHGAAPGKVHVVNIHEPQAAAAPRDATSRFFQEYVKRLRLYDSRSAKTARELVTRVGEVVAQATVQMTRRGVRDASRGKAAVGPALDWSRHGYADRAAEMRKVTAAALAPAGAPAATPGGPVPRQIAGKRILFSVSAVPDAMSVAAARELVGQPHLADHRLLPSLATLQGGPVHVIACHKTVSESQARTMLGFPDATVVSGPFGIYVVDPVQSIQLVLIAQCRDETTTRIGVQSFLEWLDEAQQAGLLARHATKRKKVVEVLARV